MRRLILPGICLLLAGCGTPLVTRQETARVWFVQGLQYEIEGDPDSALMRYSNILAENPDNAYVLDKTGRLLLREKKFREAEQYFSKAVSASPNNAEYMVNCGLAYFFDKKYPEAIRWMEKGLKKKEMPSYRAILCDLYVATNRYEDALASYRILMDTYPSNFLLSYNYGTILEKTGRIEEAKKAYLGTLALNPNFSRAAFSIATLYDRAGDEKNAEKYYLDAIRLNPKEASAYSYTAEFYLKQKSWDKAEQIVLDGIKNSGETAVFYQILGLIRFQKQDYVKAEEYYRKALTFGETSSIYFNLGVACDKLNKKDEMEADLKKAIALDSSNHLALNYLGYSYLLADKNIKEALSLIEKANKLDPDNGAYIDSLGWAYYKLGKYNAAKKLLERAVQIEDDPEVMEHLGFLYYSIHDYTKAILWWSKSLERTGKKEIRDMIDKVRGTIQSTVP